MELHKAIKEIVASKGAEMMTNIQIINYLLDYQAFKEKPATKLILRDVINAGYGESILALRNEQGWQTKFKQYEHEFIDSCGDKEELTVYVFESIAYALGMNVSGNEEPKIKSSFNVDSFFDIPEIDVQQPASDPQSTLQQGPDPTDLYTIALSFYNEGKYQQAKGFIEKAINTQPNASIPSHHLRLLGDIFMKMGEYEEAIKCYNECFSQKAKETQCTIDQLRESFKQHKVKGYENMMFFYFFCLYAAKRMTDAQWLQFVKSEARFGLMDAIRYCAENGINPVEDHFDIYFTDINMMCNWDYLYEDGTFAHESSNTKIAIAQIVLTDTSDYEKSQGWTHGYIIPLKIASGAWGRNMWGGDCVFKWSIDCRDLPFPHAHYTIDDINHWDELERIESEQFIKIQDYNAFPAFRAARNSHVKMPLQYASPWFLPSIHCFNRISILPSRWYGSKPDVGCWTSTQADENTAICYNEFYRRFELKKKTSEMKVLPVAAF